MGFPQEEDAKAEVDASDRALWKLIERAGGSGPTLGELVEAAARASVSTDPADKAVTELIDLAVEWSTSLHSAANELNGWPLEKATTARRDVAFVGVKLNNMRVATRWGNNDETADAAVAAPIAIIREVPGGDPCRILQAVARVPLALASPPGTCADLAVPVFAQAFAVLCPRTIWQALRRFRVLVRTPEADIDAVDFLASQPCPAPLVRRDYFDVGALALEALYLLEALIQFGRLRKETDDEERLLAALQRAANHLIGQSLLGAGISLSHEGLQENGARLHSLTVCRRDEDANGNGKGFKLEATVSVPNPGGTDFVASTKWQLRDEMVRKLRTATLSALALSSDEPSTIITDLSGLYVGGCFDPSPVAVFLAEEVARLVKDAGLPAFRDTPKLELAVLAGRAALRLGESTTAGYVGGATGKPTLTVEGSYKEDIDPHLTAEVSVSGVRVDSHAWLYARGKLAYDDVRSAVDYYVAFLNGLKGQAQADG